MQLSFRMFVGLLAGFLAWAVVEPTKPGRFPDTGWDAFEMRLILVFGLMVGAAVGFLNGFSRGGKRNMLVGAGLGALFGIVGMSLGYSIGGILARTIFGSVGEGFTAIPSRIVALTPPGALLGAAIGASSLSVKRAVQGLIGGAIGAAIGAGMFDLIGTVFGATQIMINGLASGMTAEVGTIPRAIYFTLLGGLIALFIGLVDVLARSAWVRLNLGRNEGKEWSMDYADNTIGRSEGAHIPLFGDPNIAPIHAVIRKQGGQYFLIDNGTPMGTGLNGQRIQQAPLNSGDVIQVGGFALEFQIKNQPAPVRAVDYRYPAPPTPSHPQFPLQSAPSQPVTAPQLQPTVVQAAMPVLVVLDGPAMGQRIPIGGPIDLGRESVAVPMSADSMASRRHAQVAPGPGGLAVTDLNSTNGTFVNGQRIQTAVLRSGDELKIGSTRFRVE